MALAFLLDENLRGALWNAVQQHNTAGVDVLDVLRVGDPPAPPLGTLDPNLLVWCAAQGRVLVSSDRHIGTHLASHWGAGHHSAGVPVLRPNWTVGTVLAALIGYDQSCEPPDMVDRIDYIP